MITSSLLAGVPEILHGFGVKDQGAPLGPLVTMGQVHGIHLGWVQQRASLTLEGHDGLLTAQSGVTLGVKTADCVPILLVDPGTKMVAVLHAGWKGTVKKIVQKALQEMKGKGAMPENILAAIGPCVRDCCFEVGHDVSNLFQKHFTRWREFVTPHATDKMKWTVDLQECNQIQICETGVLPEHVDVIPLCTACREDLFWSVRREGPTTGRMISFIRIIGLFLLFFPMTLMAGGRISGTVSLKGNAPASPADFAVVEDRSVCGDRQSVNPVQISKSREIRDVVVYLTERVEGGRSFATDTPYRLDQKGCQFVPHILLVPPGQPVVVGNSDRLRHHLRTFGTLNPPQEVIEEADRQDRAFSFDRPEFVRLGCERHRWMTAWVVVMSHPYYGVTDDHGYYELQDVPAGRYTLSFWHETLGERHRSVVVREGQKTSLDFLYLQK